MELKTWYFVSQNLFVPGMHF